LVAKPINLVESRELMRFRLPLNLLHPAGWSEVVPNTEHDASFLDLVGRRNSVWVFFVFWETQDE